MVTTLDPYLTMRKDGNRVIAYPNIYAQFNRSFNFSWRFVDPRAAVIISLFDGRNGRQDVIDVWRTLAGYDDQRARDEVERVLHEYSDLMYEAEAISPQFKPLNPAELVCNMANIDYSMERLNIPFSVLYMPTLRCGHSCRYCYADYTRQADSGELTLDEVDRLMGEMQRLKFAEVNISGGDPFLRKDIIDVLDIIFSHGFPSDVPTKSPLTDDQIKRLKAIGVDRIQISLDSPLDEPVVEFLTGRKDYFPRIMRTLHQLGEAGFKVGITSVVTAQTIDTVPRMAEYYASLGYVNRVSFSPVGASLYRTFPDLYPPPEKYVELEDTIGKMNAAYSHIFLKFSHLKDAHYMSNEERAGFFSNRPTCSGGKWAFVLLPDGKVTLCEELYYHPHFIVGDLRRQTIEEMWHSPEMLRLVEPDQSEFVGSPCHTCEMFLECHTGRGRCWKRALKAFRDEPNPEYWPDPYCPKAPAIEQRLS